MESDKQLPIFCENIRCLRRKHGLSKAAMARILGVGVKTLAALEQGAPSPRLGSSVLLKAGDYFQISTDTLLRTKIS